MKRLTTIALAATIVVFSSIQAEADEPRWHLRLFAAGFDPDFDVTVPANNPEEIRVNADSDMGYGGSIEYRFTGLLGVELGAMQGSPDVVLSGEVPGYGSLELRDSMSTLVTTIDLDLHLTPESPWFDVILGAGIASVGFSNLHYVDPDGDPFELVIENDLTYSAKAGLGIAFGRNSRWSAYGALRYVWSDIEVTEAGDPTSESTTFDFDLLHFTVGIGLAF